jgi:hypothetical protein
MKVFIFHLNWVQIFFSPKTIEFLRQDNRINKIIFFPVNQQAQILFFIISSQSCNPVQNIFPF